jgi:hypothetical protein
VPLVRLSAHHPRSAWGSSGVQVGYSGVHHRNWGTPVSHPVKPQTPAGPGQQGCSIGYTRCRRVSPHLTWPGPGAASPAAGTFSLLTCLPTNLD